MKKALSLFNREYKTYEKTYINLGTLKLLFIAVATISFIISIGGSIDVVDVAYVISTLMMMLTVFLILITPFILFIKSTLSDRKKMKIIKELPISQFRYYFTKILLIMFLTFIEVGIVYITEELFAVIFSETIFGGYGIIISLLLPLGLLLFPILSIMTMITVIFNSKFELKLAYSLTYLILTAMPCYLILANIYFVFTWLMTPVYTVLFELSVILIIYSFISLIVAGFIGDKYSELR